MEAIHFMRFAKNSHIRPPGTFEEVEDGYDDGDDDSFQHADEDHAQNADDGQRKFAFALAVQAPQPL